MPTDDEFPLVLNPAFVRYCRQLNRQHRSVVRINVDSGGLPQILMRQKYDPNDDLLFKEGGSQIVVARQDAEKLAGWELVGRETLFEDFSFYRQQVGQFTAATHPGRLPLNRRMLVQIEPELRGARRDAWNERDEDEGTSRVKGTFDAIAGHIDRGDARAALILRVEPNVLVAAYTDELDCVAVLKFPARIADVFSLQPGTRLVTCNFYRKCPDGIAQDLQPGKEASQRWQNFHPVIGNFASSDTARLQQIEFEIPDDEWQRTEKQGAEWLSRYDAGQAIPRNGSPLLSVQPAAPPSLATFTERMLATGIDLVLLWLVLATISWFAFGFDELVARRLQNPGPGPAHQQFVDMRSDIAVLSCLAYLFYCPFMLASDWHATVGKKLLRLRVVDQDSLVGVGIEQAGQRTMAFLPSATFGLLGCLLMLWSKTNQTWHDKRARTLVVKES
jgi:uncharacterized RDD family membrane protein YckC/Fe-S cluster assembly iron-binding protein IscA